MKTKSIIITVKKCSITVVPNQTFMDNKMTEN